MRRYQIAGVAVALGLAFAASGLLTPAHGQDCAACGEAAQGKTPVADRVSSGGGCVTYAPAGVRGRGLCRGPGCWHGGYYGDWCAPVAMVVPPTATSHTELSWDVGGTQVRRIRSQFARGWPTTIGGRAAARPTPAWPSHTGQYGIYYVRGPW